jgi:hypothetical protein
MSATSSQAQFVLLLSRLEDRYPGPIFITWTGLDWVNPQLVTPELLKRTNRSSVQHRKFLGLIAAFKIQPSNLLLKSHLYVVTGYWMGLITDYYKRVLLVSLIDILHRRTHTFAYHYNIIQVQKTRIMKATTASCSVIPPLTVSQTRLVQVSSPHLCSES